MTAAAADLDPVRAVIGIPLSSGNAARRCASGFA